jgi:glycosyltransferase involved in cell wall biosynthesis
VTIVFLITVGLERPSGRRYFALARALVRHGHRVRILALHPDLEHCPRRRFVQEGVEVWYVGQMHARKRHGVTERYPVGRLLGVLAGAVLGMVGGVLASPADVYHLGKPQPVNGLAALLAVGLLRRRRFYVDCDDDEATSSDFQAPWQRAVFAGWQELLPRVAAGITVNTHEMGMRLPRRAGAPLVYVPNGVDLATYARPPAAVLEGLRAALGLRGRRVVAYSGTLTLHNHPVDLLLDAFALLRHSVPDALLLLVGDGRDTARLHQQAAALGVAPDVRCTGYLPHTATRAYLALADLSADPVYDNAVARARSPLKLFESMALGVPVVTGDVGDRARLLGGGRAGVLVRAGDAAALAEGMRALLSDEARHAAMAQAARQHVQQYDWAALAENWARVYRHG